jgi:predicted nucleic acid-binding protein
MVLLDTDICICLLNQKPGYEAILKRIDGRAYGEVVISAITLAELRFGIAVSGRLAVSFWVVGGRIVLAAKAHQRHPHRRAFKDPVLVGPGIEEGKGR